MIPAAAPSRALDAPSFSTGRFRAEREADPETAKQAMDNVQEAKRLLALTRKEHLKDIRQLELDKAVDFFDKVVRQHARPTEASSFDNLVKTAQSSIDRNDKDFEHHLAELNDKIFGILWKQDWFVIERFKSMVSAPHRFTDKHHFAELMQAGEQAIRSDDIDRLRLVVAQLSAVQVGGGSIDANFGAANIIRG